MEVLMKLNQENHAENRQLLADGEKLILMKPLARTFRFFPYAKQLWTWKIDSHYSCGTVNEWQNDDKEAKACEQFSGFAQHKTCEWNFFYIIIIERERESRELGVEAKGR